MRKTKNVLKRYIMDIKEALLHPEEVFSTPKKVLDHPKFTKKQN